MNVDAEVHRNGQVFLIEEDKSDENEQCEQLSGNEADVSHENKQPSAAGNGTNKKSMMGDRQTGQKDECHDFQGPYEPCMFHLFPSNCRVCLCDPHRESSRCDVTETNRTQAPKQQTAGSWRSRRGTEQDFSFRCACRVFLLVFSFYTWSLPQHPIRVIFVCGAGSDRIPRKCR